MRIVIGLAFVAIGLVSVGGRGRLILAIVSVVPLPAGVFDVCLFAPPFGAPLKGVDVRAKAQ